MTYTFMEVLWYDSVCVCVWGGGGGGRRLTYTFMEVLWYLCCLP